MWYLHTIVYWLLRKKVSYLSFLFGHRGGGNEISIISISFGWTRVVSNLDNSWDTSTTLLMLSGRQIISRDPRSHQVHVPATYWCKCVSLECLRNQVSLHLVSSAATNNSTFISRIKWANFPRTFSWSHLLVKTPSS